MLITKKINRLAIFMVIAAVILSACDASNATSTNSTGTAELDNIIDIVLRGDKDELKSVIEFNQAPCAFNEALGGPPQCLDNETAGTVVEALPILDSEGHFLRKSDFESWDGIDVSALYAVYEVSDAAYSDEIYPAGTYALVFINKDQTSSTTLQVDQGKIVRIDYGYNFPPAIREEEVVRYLVLPVDATP
ncbi:MAG: hypothetical protein H7Y59_14685 [Anaerolineales bacterium]|nr:hypothetical protein [Anaerolineales bacterium]